MRTPAPLTPLGPVGRIVFSRHGERLGRVEAVGREAFKILAPGRELWLHRAAIARTTPGGLVLLAVRADELDEWLWTRTPA